MGGFSIVLETKLKDYIIPSTQHIKEYTSIGRDYRSTYLTKKQKKEAMMKNIKFPLIIFLIMFISSCNAQKIKQNDIHNTNKYSFIDNKKIKFKILKIADESTFPITDIGYRVIIDLDSKENRILEGVKKEEWIQMLRNNKKDYAANILLYYLYKREAAVLLVHIGIREWRISMKDDDISYWKQTLK